MDVRQVLKANMDQSAKVVSAYLNDLSDAELLVRPVPGANHIAWQLGHLIASEHDLVSMIAPGMMPPLPDGFKERHKKEHSKLDDPQHFFKKEEYVRLLKQQREGTLAVLARQSDSDLDKPAPEPLRGLLRTVGEVFVLLGSHPMMHAGQWAVTRRKLGRPPLF